MDQAPDAALYLAKPHRKAVLVALLWLTIIGGISFATLNLARGLVGIAAAELGMMFYSMFLLIAIRRSPYLERWILAYIIPFYSTMMFALWAPQTTTSVFAWVLLIPLLSHLLMGRRLGLSVSVFYMGVAALLFFLKYGHDPAMMQSVPIANIAFISLCMLAFSHVYELSRERSELRLFELAQTDVLTGLANRASFRDHFEREKQRAMREKLPLSVLIIDLDFFKRINDQYGHEAGDSVLVTVASLLRQRLRATDLACRIGGEEFGVMLPGTTAETAATVAEDLRQALESETVICANQPVTLTMSLGGAEFGRDGDSLKAILSAADTRLYQAKMLGRNQYCGVTEEQAPHESAPKDSSSFSAA